LSSLLEMNLAGAQCGTIGGGGAQRTRPRCSPITRGSRCDQTQFGRNPEEGKPGRLYFVLNMRGWLYRRAEGRLYFL